MTKLSVSNLGLAVGEALLVRDASFQLEPREIAVLLGPNGAGKTSLIRASLGLESRCTGSATFAGKETKALSPAERARHLAYLPQIRSLAWPNRVRDIVSLGRFSHGAAMGQLGESDAAAVDRAIWACDLVSLQHRRADTLSGGELARMHCARAFAAEAPLLIADEPTAALDPRHQFRILDLIKSYVVGGAGALLVLHDIELAARYATRLIWMKDGRIVADGSVTETLTEERLAEVYEVKAKIQGTRVVMEGAL